MFQINPTNLLKLLKFLSLTRVTKPYIGYIRMDITQEGAKVIQMDPTETLAVIAKINSNLFSEITGEGTIIFPVTDLIQMLKTGFKGDPTVTVSIESNNIVIKGSKGEKLSIAMPSMAEVKYLENVDLVDKEYGIFSQKAVPAISFLVLASDLKTAKTEKLKFQYSPDKVILVYKEPIMTYEKPLPYTKKVTNEEASGEAILDYDIINRISGIYGSDPIWLGFVKNGPILFSRVTDEYKITYLVTTEVE